MKTDMARICLSAAVSDVGPTLKQHWVMSRGWWARGVDTSGESMTISEQTLRLFLTRDTKYIGSKNIKLYTALQSEKTVTA